MADATTPAPNLTTTTTVRISPKRKRRDWSALLGYLLVAPPVIIMIFLIFYPAILAIVETIFLPDATTSQIHFTLEEYTGFFQDQILVANFWFTFQITLATVALLFLIGYPLALYLRFSKSRFAGAVQVLTLFPLFVPGVILAFAMIQFLGSHGMLDTILHLLGITSYHTPYLKPQGIVIALVWEGIPFSVLVLTAGLRQVEDSMVESARDVGANSWQIFSQILVPLSMRSAIIVFCLNVIGVFGAFTIPYLLGPAQPMMMGVSMQQTVNGYQDRVGALTQAVITFAVCALVGLLYVRTVSQRSERT